MLLCLPLVGLTFLDKPKSSPGTHTKLFINLGKTKATGYEATNGFVVVAKSTANKDETDALPGHISRLRAYLISQGILQDKGENYTLAQDHVFTSPSTAAGVMLGRNSNGRTEWKDEHGVTLAKIQESGANV